jgi:hypothetical protein
MKLNNSQIESTSNKAYTNSNTVITFNQNKILKYHIDKKYETEKINHPTSNMLSSPDCLILNLDNIEKENRVLRELYSQDFPKPAKILRSYIV